jgi:hypothetical protein
LNEAGGYPLAPLDSASTYYVLFIATNTSEKHTAIGTGVRASASEPSLVASGVPQQVVAQAVLNGIVDELALANSAVSEAKLKANAVTETKIADNSISTRLFIADSIMGIHIAADQIQGGHITAEGITARELKALSVISDKIAANAIVAGHLSAGSVTATKLQADLVLATRIIAGDPKAARVEMHPVNGLQAYNTSNVRTFWINAATGAAFFMGEISTAPSGIRIQMNPAGTNPDQMRFFPNTGTAFAALESFTDPDGTNAGITAKASGATSSVRVGALLLRKGYCSLGLADSSNVNRSEFYVEPAFVRSRSATVDLNLDMRITAQNGDRRVAFIYVDTSGNAVARSHLNYMEATGDPTPRPWLQGVGGGSGLKFQTGEISVTTGSHGTYGPIAASAFNVGSSVDLKENVGEISVGGDRTSWDVIEGAPSLDWHYTFEGQRPDKPRMANGEPVKYKNIDTDEESEAQWDHTLPARKKHRFPLADDLKELDLELVRQNALGEDMVDLRDMVGVLWDAVDKLIKRTRIYEEIIAQRVNVTLPTRPQKGDMVEGVGKLKPGRTHRDIDPTTRQAKGKAYGQASG